MRSTSWHYKIKSSKFAIFKKKCKTIAHSPRSKTKNLNLRDNEKSNMPSKASQ